MIVTRNSQWIYKLTSFWLLTWLRLGCEGFPHIVIEASWKSGAAFKYKGACLLDIEDGDFSWTVNITFNKDISHFQLFNSEEVAIHQNGRWICVTNNKLPPQPPQIYGVEFVSKFIGNQEPHGECFVLKNTQTQCLDHDPTTAASSQVEHFFTTTVPIEPSVSATQSGSSSLPVPTLTTSGSSSLPIPTLTTSGSSSLPVPTVTTSGSSSLPIPTLTTSGSSSLPIPTLTTSGSSSLPIPTLTTSGSSSLPIPTLTMSGSSSLPIPTLTTIDLQPTLTLISLSTFGQSPSTIVVSSTSGQSSNYSSTPVIRTSPVVTELSPSTNEIEQSPSTIPTEMIQSISIITTKQFLSTTTTTQSISSIEPSPITLSSPLTTDLPQSTSARLSTIAITSLLTTEHTQMTTEASVESTSTNTSSVWSNTTTTSSVTSTHINQCFCKISDLHGNSSDLYSQQTFKGLLEALLVDKATLSKTRRKLTSAADDRVTSRSIGILGIVCMSVVFGLMLMVDISHTFVCI